MRKTIGFILLIAAAVHFSGCASVQKKFIRKKKEPKHVPAAIFYQTQTSTQKKYSNAYYYKTHYIFWRSWQADLIVDLKGGNDKKLKRSAQEALSNLTGMSGYLNPQKQAELKPMLDSLSQIIQRIEGGQISSSVAGTLQADAEKIRRVVSNDFYYDKVKDDVLPDTVDL